MAECGNVGLDDLTIRYDEPPGSVYTRSTRYILSTDSNLDILCRAGVGFERGLVYLPSWVPDWSQPPEVRPFSDLAHLGKRNASCGKKSRLSFDPEDPSRITMDGIILDKITKISSIREKFCPSDPRGYSMRLLEWVAEVEQMVLLGAEKEEDEQTRDDMRKKQRRVLWKTLAPEDPKPPYEEGPRTATQRGFDAWLRYLLLVAASPVGATSDLFTPEEVTEGKFFEVACTYATTHRRAFLTSKGHVGLGYQGTRVEDEVAVLFGGVAPFIIRPATAELCSLDKGRREYQLVGEAYLHGFENGEGIDQGRVESLVFV